MMPGILGSFTLDLHCSVGITGFMVEESKYLLEPMFIILALVQCLKNILSEEDLGPPRLTLSSRF